MATVIRGSDNFDSSKAGKVLNVTTYTNSTRQALTAASSITMASFTVNKLSSTSTLVIHGSISGHDEYSGSLQQGWKLGSGTEVNAQGISYINLNAQKNISTAAVITGHTTTGSQTMVFRYYAVSGSSSRPFNIYNPNTSDDNRNAQSSSVFSVTEVEA
jgi:hypothetical protein